jgi:acid stress-induced BolA-like protein IbaG/YrbA
MVDPQEVHRLIAKALPGARIQVLDPMRDGEHLQAIVAADCFVGMPLVKQHKLVMEALREVLQGRLHALQLKTMTPEQYDKEYA